MMFSYFLKKLQNYSILSLLLDMIMYLDVPVNSTEEGIMCSQMTKKWEDLEIKKVLLVKIILIIIKL